MASQDDSFKNAPTEATEWLVTVRENPDDPRVRAAFEYWISQSAENRRTWEQTIHAWQALAHVPLAADSKTERPRSSRTGVARKVLGPAAVVGLSLCLIMLAGPSLLIRLQADYLTGTGESRSITLADGSEVTLAPDSALALSFNEGKRGVVLLKGEAFFEVQHDETRPFEVTGGGLDVEVLGTGFDVRIDGNTSSVALAHGSIRASTETDQRILLPGDVLTLDENTGALSEASVDVADIGLWREGRLFVVNQTIGSVIEQIRRYHPAWIALPDPALAAQKVTGIYDLRSPDEALGALVDPYGGRVRKISNMLRIVSRL